LIFYPEIGEILVMLDDKDDYQIRNNFGKLELVDKEIFYISFNRRDN